MAVRQTALALWFLGLWIVSATLSIGAPVSELAIPVCDAPPKLDTDLSDPAWQSALKLTGFKTLGTDRDTAIRTTAWLCRDNAWLYIAFRCDEPKPANVQRGVTERDGPVSQDDSVEIFLDPGTASTRHFHFMLSAGNVQADQRCRGEKRDRAWDLPCRSAARLDPHIDSAKGWSAELAIPLAPLQAAAGTNEWRINLCRTRRASEPREFMSLAPLPKGAGFHSPQHFLPVSGLTGFRAETMFGPMLKRVEVTPLAMEGGRASYGIVATVGNDSGKPGTVEVVVRDVPLKGEGVERIESLTLTPVDERRVETRLEIPDIGRRQAWVGLRLPGADEWLQSMDVPGMELLCPFEAYVERNYYTTEEEAMVRIEMRTGAEARKDFSMTAELMGEKGRVLVSGKAKCDLEDIGIPLSLKRVPDGVWPVRVSLFVKKQPLGSVDLELVKRPRAPDGAREVKIDRYNRCLLVDGAPFFPVGAVGMFYHGKFEGWKKDYFDAQYRFSQEAGLNVILDWTRNRATEESVAEAKERYDMALQYGLRIIGLPYASNPDIRYSNPKFREAAGKVIAEMDLYLTMARSHPAVIAYYHFDEPQPGLNIDDILIAYRDKVRSLDPYHPVYMSLTRYIHDPRWFEKVADLLGAHNYWYVMRPRSLNVNAEAFEKVDRHARKAHGPTMQLPQLDCWGTGYSDGGFMAPHEQRAQTYFALIHGAKSVIYFVLPWKHQLSVATQKRISEEIQAMAPALLTREPRQEVTFEPHDAYIPGADHKPIDLPIVQTALRNEPLGDQVLLAINGSHDREVTARFGVSSLTDKSGVSGVFDGKSYPVADGSFEDTIEPWGTRVYRLKNVRRDKNAPIRIHLAMSGPATVAGEKKPAAAPTLGENLAVNPGFEEKGAWGRFTKDPEMARSGQAGLALRREKAEGRPAEVICLPIPLKPETKYRFGAWVKAEIAEGKRLPCVLVHSSTRTDGLFRINTGVYATRWTNEWQELSGSFTSPTGAAEKVWIYCRIPPGTVGKAWFDDVWLREEIAPAPAVAAPKNLVRNSSFERARMPGHPDSWMARAWDILPPDPRANGIETSNPFHGKYCYRIARPNTGYENFAYSDGLLIKTDRPYTLSFYARADRPNATIRVYGSGEMQSFKAGPDWNRFSRTFTPKASGYHVCIYPIGKGMFYLDAVQLEEGSRATEYEE